MADKDFSYMLIIGNSRMGKTTYAKTLVKSLKDQGSKILVADPNRQWYDLLDQEVGSSELANALNTIAKPLLFEKKEGVLVIEDIGFSLQQICTSLGFNLSKAKGFLKIILENARKYNLKVIMLAHRLQADEIDSIMLNQFDSIVFFNTPLTPHSKSLIKELQIEPNQIVSLRPFHYIKLDRWNRSIVEGKVEPIQSHVKIENDRNFQVHHLLSKCHTDIEKVALLKLQLKMRNTQISKTLNIDKRYVKIYISRLRKRGLEIPDGRKTPLEAYQNLMF